MADELGGGAQLVGSLSAVFGIGAAVGMAALALMRGRMASARVSSIGLCGLAGGCAVLAIATVPAVAMSGFALAGLGFGWAMTGPQHGGAGTRTRGVARPDHGAVAGRVPRLAADRGGAARRDRRRWSACRRRSRWPRR